MHHVHIIVQIAYDEGLILKKVRLYIFMAKQHGNRLLQNIEALLQLPVHIGTVPPQHGIGRKKHIITCFGMSGDLFFQKSDVLQNQLTVFCRILLHDHGVFGNPLTLVSAQGPSCAKLFSSGPIVGISSRIHAFMAIGQHKRNLFKQYLLVIQVGNVVKKALRMKISGRILSIQRHFRRGIQRKKIKTPKDIF